MCSIPPEGKVTTVFPARQNASLNAFPYVSTGNMFHTQQRIWLFFLFAIGVLVGTFLNTVKEEEQSIEGCYCLSGMIFCYCACPIDQNFPWSTLSVFYSYLSGWTCRNEVELVQKHHPGDMGVHCSSLLHWQSFFSHFQMSILFFGFDLGEAFQSWCWKWSYPTGCDNNVFT